MHAEYNHSPDQPVRLNQIWIMPRTKGNPPRWEQKQFSRQERTDRWLPIAGGRDDGALPIDQDATVYVSSLPATHRAIHRTEPGRKVYLFVIAGGVSVNGTKLASGDQARIEQEVSVDVQAEQDAELILIDLPE